VFITTQILIKKFKNLITYNDYTPHRELPYQYVTLGEVIIQ